MRKPRNLTQHPLASLHIGKHWAHGRCPRRRTPIYNGIFSVPYRCFSIDRPSGSLGSKHKPFHGQREAIFFVGTGHKPGSMLHV